MRPCLAALPLQTRIQAWILVWGSVPAPCPADALLPGWVRLAQDVKARALSERGLEADLQEWPLRLEGLPAGVVAWAAFRAGVSPGKGAWGGHRRASWCGRT